MIIMYLRKSRSDDASMSVSDVLAKHESILQDYAIKTYGQPIPESSIYREVVSGETIDGRPEMQRLLNFITNNDISGVLVVEPQRLSRGDLMDCGQIIRIFKYSNTKIITPNKTFDLNDKYDYKFLQMELMQGNEYLEYTKMILKRGRDASRQKGCYIGSHAPYGYDKIKIDKMPTLSPNNESPIVQLIFQLFINGYGTSQICNELTERGIKPPRTQHWSTDTIKKILSNEIYIGKIPHGKRSYQHIVDNQGNMHSYQPRNKDYVLFDGIHQPIIDSQTFQIAKQKLGKQSREPSMKTLQNAYAGLLKCPCGYSMTRQHVPNYEPELHCTHRKYCHNKSIKYDRFTELLITHLKSILTDFSVEIENESNDDKNINKSILNALHDELNALEKQQDKLYDLLEKGIYSDEVFTTRNNKLSAERERITKAIKKAEADTTKKERTEAFTLSLHQAIDTLADNSIPAKAKNTFLKTFIDKIVYDGDIHISFL